MDMAGERSSLKVVESTPFRKKQFISLPKFPTSSTNEDNVGDYEFLYKVTDFDFCKLNELELENVKDCDICLRLKSKKVSTRYICSECNIACCPECYDIHHREQLLKALRTFRKDCPHDLDIRISEEGNFFMKKCIDPLKDTSKVTRCDEFWETICINNLDEVVEYLENTCATRTELMFDLERKFRGIFFQDKQMEKFFSYYPEFVTVDITCEIVELELAMYLFIGEDSNGHCEILAACMMNGNNTENFMWMFEIFKKHNSNWKKIRLVAADKQIKNRNAIRVAFPDSQIVMCKVQAMKSFKNDISNQDFEMAEADKLTALKIFENMIRTTKNSEYIKQQEQLTSLTTSIGTYFNENWHPMKEEWALGMKFNCKIFSPSSNFLQHAKKKLKFAINARPSLISIVKKFFAVLATFRKERYRKIGIVLHTAPTPQYAKNTPHYKYSKLLTLHAAGLAIHQLNLASEVKNLRKLSCGRYEMKTSSQTLTVTTNSCSCSFYSFMLLPCCHIFAVRKLLSLPLYVETVSAVRWIAKYYQTTFLSLHATFIADTCKHLSWSQKKNVEDKFRKSFELIGQLLPLLLENSPDLSQRRNIIRQLVTAWKEMIKVRVKISEGPKLPIPSKKDLVFDEDYSIAHLKDIYGISPHDNKDSDEDFSSFSFCSDGSTDELSCYLSGQIDTSNTTNDVN